MPSINSHDPLQIVAIDDHPGDARLVHEYLRESDLETIEWEENRSLEPGIEHAHDLDPDVVIVDLTLPEHTPRETLERLEQLPGRSAVVVLTGSNARHVGRSSLRYGADGYLNKEFLQPELLRTTIEGAIERSRLQRESRVTKRAIEATHNGVVICDARRPDLPIVFCNEAFEEMTGYDEDEIIGRNCRFLQEEATAREPVRDLARAIDQGESVTVEILNERKDGTSFWNQLSLSPIHDERGRVTHYVGIQRDITRRVEAKRDLREQKRELETYETIIENTTDAVSVSDGEGTIQLVNERYVEMLDRPREALVGRTEPELFETFEIERERLSEQRESVGDPIERIEEAIEIEGERRIFLTMELPFEESGETIGTIRIRRDITERKQAQQQLKHQATHDNLTGLPNRALFRKRLSEIVSARRPFAIGFIDLDDFKSVNDSLGHACGDRLLERVGERLTDVMRKDDMIARVGGDEFTCLLQHIDSHDQLAAVADRLVEAFAPPFQMREGEDLYLSASIGFAHLDRTELEDDTRIVHAESLRRTADRAMYRAKHQAGTTWELFDPSSRGARSQKIQRENRVRTALQREEFVPYYQPIYDLQEEASIPALEVLARWPHPERGLVSPAEFIPVAERSDLIGELCESLIEASAHHVEQWTCDLQGETSTTLFFNLSPVQVERDDIVDTLDRTLDSWDHEAFSVGFEVTESHLLEHSERIQELRSRGYDILVDDFGTGYSSLSRLKELQVDGLKIDMQFVLDMLESSSDAAIVETIIDLGHRLGIPVIAEGIEDEEQIERLRAMGCDFGQGFHLDRPMPAEEHPTQVDAIL